MDTTNKVNKENFDEKTELVGAKIREKVSELRKYAESLGFQYNDISANVVFQLELDSGDNTSVSTIAISNDPLGAGVLIGAGIDILSEKTLSQGVTPKTIRKINEMFKRINTTDIRGIATIVERCRKAEEETTETEIKQKVKDMMKKVMGRV